MFNDSSNNDYRTTKTGNNVVLSAGIDNNTVIDTMSVPVTATYVILANVILARTNDDYNHSIFDTQIYQIALGSYVNGTSKMEILDRKVSPVRTWICSKS